MRNAIASLTITYSSAVCLIFSAILLLFGPPLCLADRIPQGFDHRTVAFIFVKDTNGVPQPNGTCFFVRADTSSNSFMCYLVTAKHVLQDSEEHFLSDVLVRLTKENAEASFVYFPLLTSNSAVRVYSHPNPNVDLAVVPVTQSTFLAHQIQMFPTNLIATPEHFKRFDIRVGDEMFFMGLFTSFFGAKSNVPVTRFGRLSALTDEPIIAFKNRGPQYYYLMEANAFGGNSGSPTFFAFDGIRNPGDTKILIAGVVTGAYQQRNGIEVVEAKATPISKENLGISLITPGYQLLELLNSDELKSAIGAK